MTASLCEKSVSAFADVLASKAPVPGGGGAAAAAGALAAALGEMVCNLTAGKPKYAAFEAAVAQDLAALTACRHELLALVDRDAEAFSAISAAYATAKTDPARPAIMEAALNTAAEPPLCMMAVIANLIDVLAGLRTHCSALVLSDVGCAAALAAAALQAAALNVWVNTASIQDRARADELNAEVAHYTARADAAANLYTDVAREIAGTR